MKFKSTGMKAENVGTEAYENWMEMHRKLSKGERLRRLKDVSRHAEEMFATRVWWAAFGNFDHLHPEYEIRDYKDGWRYLDFAYVCSTVKICIEVDGFGPHWRDVSRKDFSDRLMRQNHLVIDGWTVLRFSYDDIVDRPRQCQQALLQLMGKWSVRPPAPDTIRLSPAEIAILRLAASTSKPLTPILASSAFGLHRTTAVRHIRSLVTKGYLAPTSPGAKRVCSYRIQSERMPYGGW